MSPFSLPGYIQHWIQQNPTHRKASVDAVTLPNVSVVLSDGAIQGRGECRLPQSSLFRLSAETELTELQNAIDVCVETAFLRALSALDQQRSSP